MDVSESQWRAGQALELIEDAIGFIYPAALGAVARLGVADHLATGPRTVSELARATGTHAPLLQRVLRLLAARGLLGEDGQGRYHLTPRGESLCTDAPLSVRKAIMNITAPYIWRPAGEIVTTLREGEPAFDHLFGTPFFSYLAQDLELGEIFQAGTSNLSEVFEVVVAELLDLPEKGTVVDVGGGSGGQLLQFLRRNEGLRGVLFDLPHVLEGHRLGALGADDRWELAPGDFFAEVPAGGDIYYLGAVLHNWSDEQGVTILRNCLRAMAPGARVLIGEAVVDPDGDSSFGQTMDVFMMGILPGKERTIAEYRTLLANAGFRLNRVISTGTPASIIEAVAA